MITASRLRELIRYDEATGKFFRLVALRGGRVGPLHLAPAKNGYLYIMVDGKKYLAHRLAWLYVTGAWPTQQVDHRNTDKVDNRFDNLRDVAPVINNENRRKTRSDNQSSGLTGVSWHEHSRRWRARITVRGEEIRLGLFSRPEDASSAYVAAKRSLHEGCTI